MPDKYKVTGDNGRSYYVYAEGGPPDPKEAIDYIKQYNLQPIEEEPTTTKTPTMIGSDFDIAPPVNDYTRQAQRQPESKTTSGWNKPLLFDMEKDYLDRFSPKWRAEHPTTDAALTAGTRFSNSLQSPIGLGTGAVLGGMTAASPYVGPITSRIFNFLPKAAAGAMAVQGGNQLLNGEDLATKIEGGLNAALGIGPFIGGYAYRKLFGSSPKATPEVNTEIGKNKSLIGVPNSDVFNQTMKGDINLAPEVVNNTPIPYAPQDLRGPAGESVNPKQQKLLPPSRVESLGNNLPPVNIIPSDSGGYVAGGRQNWGLTAQKGLAETNPSLYSDINRTNLLPADITELDNLRRQFPNDFVGGEAGLPRPNTESAREFDFYQRNSADYPGPNQIDESLRGTARPGEPQLANEPIQPDTDALANQGKKQFFTENPTNNGGPDGPFEARLEQSAQEGMNDLNKKLGWGTKQPTDINLTISNKPKTVSEERVNPEVLGSEVRKVASPDNIHPTLTDAQESIPHTNADELQLPKPGRATTNEPGAVRASFQSPDISNQLRNNPHTGPITNDVIKTEDLKMKWVAEKLHDAADSISGFNKESLARIYDYLDGSPVNLDYKEQNAAIRLRGILDQVRQDAVDAGIQIGKIEEYITHIQKNDENLFSGLMNTLRYYGLWGKNQGTTNASDLAGLFNLGLGNPKSPYTMTRTGNVNTLEKDLTKVLPMYLESMGKIIHDAPLMDRIKPLIKNMPDGVYKELMTQYARQYANFTNYPAFKAAAARFNNTLATMENRALISLNPNPHMYHLGQLLGTVYPVLGEKYTLTGAKQFFSNPAAAYHELARLGLLSGNSKPLAFQTPMQRVDSIGYYGSILESVSKGIAYYGTKAKLNANGIFGEEATMQAINEAKRLTLAISPARSSNAFGSKPEGLLGVLGKEALRFKQTPAKYAELGAQIFANAWKGNLSDKAVAARFLAANTALGLITANSKLHLLHVGPSMMDLGLPAKQGIQEMYHALLSGDKDKFIEKFTKWLVPGGASITHWYKQLNQ